MTRSANDCSVLAAFGLCWALLFLGPAILLSAERIPNATGPEKWVDGPENVQVGNSRSFPDVGVANSGMRIHVWSEGGINGSSAGEIILRRWDAEGNPLEDPKQVNTTTDDIQRHARVAVSADGSFLVIFQSWEEGPAERIVIRSRAYGSNGNPLGPEQKVSTNITKSATDVSADVAALRASGGGAGGIAVVWHTLDSVGSDTGVAIAVCMFSTSGVPGAEFQVYSTDGGGQK